MPDDHITSERRAILAALTGDLATVCETTRFYPPRISHHHIREEQA